MPKPRAKEPDAVAQNCKVAYNLKNRTGNHRIKKICVMDSGSGNGFMRMDLGKPCLFDGPLHFITLGKL